MRSSHKDLFHRFKSPPSPIHKEVQRRAKEAGWTPPWDREEQQKEQQYQKEAAGKKSGRVRRKRAELRHQIIEAAYARLNTAHKHQPYSRNSIDALLRQYLSLLGKNPIGPHTPPTNDELEAFSLGVSAIKQLPEPDRVDALSDEYCRLNETAASRTTLTEEAIDLSIEILMATRDLSETELQALQQVSRETLKKGLIQLGVKAACRTKQFG